jgi:chitin synthase
VFTFFILNALYVTIIFLMTLEKDKVHLNWPLGVQYNVSYEYFESPSWPTVRKQSIIPIISTISSIDSN